jgi:hypothetical protein
VPLNGSVRIAAAQRHMTESVVGKRAFRTIGTRLGMRGLQTSVRHAFSYPNLLRTLIPFRWYSGSLVGLFRLKRAVAGVDNNVPRLWRSQHKAIKWGNHSGRENFALGWLKMAFALHGQPRSQCIRSIASMHAVRPLCCSSSQMYRSLSAVFV